VDANRGRLSSGLITDLNRLMQRLSRTGLRHGDQLDQTFLPPLRKPIYVMLQDHDRAERLAKQLEFFGLSAGPGQRRGVSSSMAERLPAAIVMDVDFSGPGLGLQLAAEAQEGLEQRCRCCSSACTKPTPRPASPPCAPAARNSSPAPWKRRACWKRSKC
jgi:PleD family two-component response regulator